MVVQRMALTALALLPGAVMLTLPSPLVSQAIGSLGMAGLLGTSALISVVAVHASGFSLNLSRIRRTASRQPDDLGALLLPRAHRRPPPDFPDLARQRAHVHQRLEEDKTIPLKPYGDAEPDRIETALAAIMAQVTELWGVARPADLSDAQIRELFMLDRLAQATPDMAGQLAQNFRNPSLAIDIRDKIAALRVRRIRFEMDRDAYEATAALARSDAPPQSLFDAIEALGVPDPELWHHVICDHDPTDIAQRDAALACVSEPDCNRATVALWFFDLVLEGRLEQAARDGDTAFLDGVRDVIAQWNDNAYRRDEIGLSPPELVSDGALAVARCLDRVAETAQTPRWDMPVGMFEDYPGRAPYPRPAWDIREGRVVAAPHVRDYLPVT